MKSTSKRNQNNDRYEILDNMEMIIATAQTIEDARYAKESRNAKLIYDILTEKCVK